MSPLDALFSFKARDRNRTGDLVLTKDALYRLSYASISGRRGSNPRPSAWKADALPTELRPRARRSGGGRIRTFVGCRRQIYSLDRKSTRLNSSHSQISYAVFCLKKK